MLNAKYSGADSDISQERPGVQARPRGVSPYRLFPVPKDSDDHEHDGNDPKNYLASGTGLFLFIWHGHRLAHFCPIASPRQYLLMYWGLHWPGDVPLGMHSPLAPWPSAPDFM